MSQNLSDKAEDFGVALLIVAVIVGNVAMPFFTGVNTANLTGSQLLMWGLVLTLGLLGLGLAFMRWMRGGKKR